MHRASPPSLPRLPSPRRLILTLCPAWLLLAAGCAQLLPSQAAAVVRGQAPTELPPARLQAPVITQAPAQALPPPQSLPPATAEEALPERALPIHLDTVPRPAQDPDGPAG